MKREDVIALVRREALAIVPIEKRQLFEQDLIEPRCEDREYDPAFGIATGRNWIVATIEARVGIAYSEKDYGETGCRWGLGFLSQSSYGSSGSWYRSLRDLVDDCGSY